MSRSGILKRLSFVLGGLLVVWLLIAIFFDPEPVDDSDLQISDRIVDPAQNPYPEIRDFQLSPDQSEELERVSSMMSGGEAMDEVFLESMIVKYQPELERFERYSRMMEWKVDEKLTTSMRHNYLFNWARLAPLKCAECVWMSERNQKSEALGSAKSLLAFPSQLRRSDPPSFGVIIANVISETGTCFLVEWLRRNPFGESSLSELSSSLDSIDSARRGLQNAFCIEYSFWNSGTKEVVDDRLGDRLFLKPLVFKPNRTLALNADVFRVGIQGASMPFSAARPRLESMKNPDRRFIVAQTLTGNAAGMDLVSDTAGFVEMMIEETATEIARLQLLRTLVGFHRYRLEHGQWPDDISSLIPDYLDSVPMDPMNGNPVRYNSHRRILYSVGTDFIDDGGVAAYRKGSMRENSEIAIFLEPTEPSPWPDFSAVSKPENSALKSPPSPESSSPEAQKAPSQRRVPLP